MLMYNDIITTWKISGGLPARYPEKLQQTHTPRSPKRYVPLATNADGDTVLTVSLDSETTLVAEGVYNLSGETESRVLPMGKPQE